MSTTWNSGETSCSAYAVALPPRQDTQAPVMRSSLPADDINRLATMRGEWAAGSTQSEAISAFFKSGGGSWSTGRSSEVYCGRRLAGMLRAAASPPNSRKEVQESEDRHQKYGFDGDDTVTHIALGQTMPQLSDLDSFRWVGESATFPSSPVAVARGVSPNSGATTDADVEGVGSMEGSVAGENDEAMDGKEDVGGDQVALFRRIGELGQALHRKDFGLAPLQGDGEVLAWGRSCTVCFDFP